MSTPPSGKPVVKSGVVPAIAKPPFIKPAIGDPAVASPGVKPRRPSGSVPIAPAVKPQKVPVKAVATAAKPVGATGLVVVPVGPIKPVLPDIVPPQHHSSEANEGRDTPFLVQAFVGGFPIGSPTDFQQVFPEWIDVDERFPVATLEGVVTPDSGLTPPPHVSYQDLPISHYTHDFCFKVRPDSTPDKRFTNLLGLDDSKGGAPQPLIEVEWECGLGADNGGNVCSPANSQGASAGFFSAGHQRRDVIWNWPTVGDWVHVVGRWIWDRGHTPATEIHPPRLVAIRRHLPEALQISQGIEPGPTVVATRIDVFASGDGGALTNNRGLVPYATPVKMSEMDYAFEVAHLLHPPAMGAKLKFATTAQAGNTFNAAVTISSAPEDRHKAIVVIPWRSANVDPKAVLARTFWLYWDTTPSYTFDQTPRLFNINLESIHVYNSQDPWPSDGEYRVFVEAGGKWWFVNEMPNVGDILQDGLGDTGDADPPEGQPWGISRQVQVCVLPGDTFRVHACGWEADGADTVFGHLIDPNHPHDANLVHLVQANLLTSSVFNNGSEDDPIGEITTIHSAPAYGTDKPEHLDVSKGDKVQSSVWGWQDTDPNGSFGLKYSIKEFPNFFPPGAKQPSQTKAGKPPVAKA